MITVLYAIFYKNAWNDALFVVPGALDPSIWAFHTTSRQAVRGFLDTQR